MESQKIANEVAEATIEKLRNEIIGLQRAIAGDWEQGLLRNIQRRNEIERLRTAIQSIKESPNNPENWLLEEIEA